MRPPPPGFEFLRPVPSVPPVPPVPPALPALSLVLAPFFSSNQCISVPPPNVNGYISVRDSSIGNLTIAHGHGHGGYGGSLLTKPHTCRNCGLIGHLYRDCPHPTMSFGIICFRVRAGMPEYLMIQRKDSLSFMEFIRGKYQTDQIDYIKKLMTAMTETERGYLRTLAFETLWNHVWYQPCIPKQTAEYTESKRKFEILRNGFLHCGSWVNLEELLKQAPSPFTEPEWGFPKGRRRLREEDIDCAVREFCEETGYKPPDLALLSGIPPFEEIFYGTNSVLYRHVYYVAYLQGDSERNLTIDPRNINQAREVRAITWFTYQDTLNHIRTHNRERKTLFNQAHIKVTDWLAKATLRGSNGVAV